MKQIEQFRTHLNWYNQHITCEASKIQLEVPEICFSEFPKNAFGRTTPDCLVSSQTLQETQFGHRPNQ